MLHLIGIDETKSATLIAEITQHIPFWSSLGTIRVVNRSSVLAADGSIYGYDQDGDFTWRVSPTRYGAYECTEWHAGVQLSRVVTWGPRVDE